MERYIYSRLIFYEEGIKIFLDYRRLRKSPNRKPCIIYRNKGYEIKNGIIDIKEKGFKEKDCRIYWYRSDFDAAIHDLMQVIIKLDNYKFLTEREFQKLTATVKPNHEKYIYVFVKLPYHGDQLLPLRISPNNRASVVYKGKGYEILKKYYSFDESECKGFYTEKNIKQGNVQVSLVMNSFKYRLRPLYKRDMPTQKKEGINSQKIKKQKTIRLSGSFG